MKNLNGDGKIIVDLLSEKIKDSNDQINKRMDNFILSNEKLIHSHCQRIRKCEEENVGIRPVKKFYEKLRDYALGLIIFLGGTVFVAAMWIKNHLT